jgi:putative transposase
MRDLFKRLNNTEIEVNISTFSKASSHRSQQALQQIYQQLSRLIQRKNLHDKYTIWPIDSTIISLTSKLLWSLGYHSFKLFSSLNLQTGTTEENLIVFGFNHDYKYGKRMVDTLPENGLGVMDRGFTGLKFLQNTVQSDKYFVLRIGNKYKLDFDENSELTQVGTGKKRGWYRVIQFCDLETKVEYRLVTNLPKTGEGSISDEEVMDIYRCRWGIELLWKFLKMHLKLDHLITKNINGIAIQIYATLIAYLILQLVEIPQVWGDKLLDKLRYLQACMCQEISYVHWIESILSS